jgi:4-amino-4-deoxy-L-arabinose transferase-like glycosyltransferase
MSGPNLPRWDSAYLPPILLGLGVRLFYLQGAFGIDPYADEKMYLHFARLWDHFGVYSDWGLFLRPPGYTFVLKSAIATFGEHGPDVVRAVQVVASLAIGLSVMWLARAVFDRRAAIAAGFLWSLYLPLVGYTHLLWAESLFLALFVPSLALFVAYVRVAEEGGEGLGLLVACGLLWGLALLFKEVGTFLLPVLVLWIAVVRRRTPRLALAHAAVLLLSTAVVVAPWTLRNRDVYERFVPVGTTLGNNVAKGLNANLMNYDYQSNVADLYPTGGWVRRTFLSDPPPWWDVPRPRNVIDLNRDYIRAGLSFAGEHPAYIARTRVVKLADLMTPVSFIVRHCRLHLYGSPVDADPLRRFTVIAGLLSAPLLMLTAWAGIVCAGGHERARWILLSVVIYVVLTSMILALSRVRVPMVPLWIVFAGGFASQLGRGLSVTRSRVVALAGGGLVLAFLWAMHWHGVVFTLREAW